LARIIVVFAPIKNEGGDMMKIAKLSALFLCFVLFASNADARGGGGGRVSYGGGHHTVSHGGSYSGGSGSSHRGGHYVNSNTGNRYGTHQ
jgi:hypothetical protein